MPNSQNLGFINKRRELILRTTGGKKGNLPKADASSRRAWQRA